MKFKLDDTVCLKSGNPGTIIRVSGPIDKFSIQSAYVVNWVDGNIDVHVESELYPITELKAVNDDDY